MAQSQVAISSAVFRTVAVPSCARFVHNRAPQKPRCQLAAPWCAPHSLSFRPLHSSFLGTRTIVTPSVPSTKAKPPAKVTASAADGAAAPEKGSSAGGFAAWRAANPGLETGFYFFLWYLFNVIFNIINKKIYNYFPYPYFVSLVHLLVGAAYCLVAWALNLPKRQEVDGEVLKALAPVALMHSAGHVATNVSFAAVAVSFTHTIKALEPFFNAIASYAFMGERFSIPVILSLLPVVLGVSAASMTELSFNWPGFWSAMLSNITFTLRNVFSKKAMNTVKGLDSTNLYAYITLISVAMCSVAVPIMEPTLAAGWKAAAAKVGMQKLLSDLFFVGLFYHLYNQVAFNALERVAPLTHAVGNVLKRVFVIFFSVLAFGNVITFQTGVGTSIALLGVGIYSILRAQEANAKKAAAAKK